MRHSRLVVGALCAFAAILVLASASPATTQAPVDVWMQGVDSLDPAIAYGGTQWKFLYATETTLVRYADDPGPAGGTLVPDAAAAMPTVSSDGLTYTFTIRTGLGFAPPSNEQVTPQSFVRAFERAARVPGAQATSFAEDITGFHDYETGAANSISGLTVSGDELAIHLIKADGTMLARLAMPFFAAVPTSTGETPDNAIPSAGPYYVDPASVATTDFGATVGTLVTSFRLLVNPNYGGVRTHSIDEFDVTSTSDPHAAYLAAQGSSPTYDVLDFVQRSDQSDAAANYGPGSPAAEAGDQQYYAPAANVEYYLAMNTQRVGDSRVRRAIATAIDRTTLATDLHLQPSDQYVPPTMPGYQDANLYPLGGDVAAAQTLMQDAGYGPANHLPLTLLGNSASSAFASFATHLATELANIYIDVTQRLVPPNVLFSTAKSDPNSYDLFEYGWFADYADIYDMLDPLLDGRQISTDPTSLGANYSLWNDQATDDSFDFDNALTGQGRLDALEQQADSLAANDAPMAAIGSGTQPEFFSSRVGCIVPHLVYGVDLTRLCLANSVDAGGTYTQLGTVSSGTPVLASVTTPTAGSVSAVTVTQTSQVQGYAILGQQVVIEAPAATVDAPLQLTFTIDGSTLAAAGVDASNVTVLRNGAAAADCPGSATASPDPCVTARSTDAAGDAIITVLSSHASTWSLGVPDATPPVLHSVSLAPPAIAPGATTTLSASADGDAVAAEFYVDSDAGPGRDTPMGGRAGAFFTPPFGGALAEGDHTIGVRVRDAAGNWSGVDTVSLTVRPETSLSFTAPVTQAFGPADLEATLTDSSGHGVAGQTVAFTAGGHTYTALTDGSGHAVVVQPPFLLSGRVDVTFGGGDGYGGSSTHASLTVAGAFGATNGWFVSTTGSVGETAAFWGSQWWKRNTAGGDGPASFKGFVRGATPSGCGGTWTAEPGSAAAPSSVPAGGVYLAVAVASGVTKRGASVTGDITHIVAVRTESGGSGTVVGTVC